MEFPLAKIEKPLLFIAFTILGDVVPATAVLLDIINCVIPLLVSCKKLDHDAELLDLSHTKSG